MLLVQKQRKCKWLSKRARFARAGSRQGRGRDADKAAHVGVGQRGAGEVGGGHAQAVNAELLVGGVRGGVKGGGGHCDF